MSPNQTGSPVAEYPSPTPSLMIGAVAGLGTGLGVGLGYSATGLPVWFGLIYSLGIALGVGLGFMLFTTRTWPASVAFVQLARRWHSPIRLMRFLEDAHQRQVLRIVGPVYQFRHARLQDRLAKQAPPTARHPHPSALAGQNDPGATASN